MNVSFYNGVSGLVTYQNDMDVISHNIANVNTSGFKASRSSFSELMYTAMDVHGDKEYLTGHGVRPLETDLIFGQGPMVQTQHPMDYAIMGDGLFAVERQDGSTEYTRNGAFDLTISGKKGYLVTADGSYVLDGKGKRIELTRPDATSAFDLSAVGEKLGVYTFPNPYDLEPVSSCNFKETAKSGAPVTVAAGKMADRPYKLIQGALEQSGVELSEEMVNVIVAQKAFQFSAKMVQTADQMEEIVNNLR